MALKSIAFKLEESKIDALKAVCDKADISQADFINRAIDREISEIITVQSGGLILTIPSPYIYQEMSDEVKDQIIDLMNETAYQFSKIAGGKLDLGLHALAGFVEFRLNEVNENRDRQRMRDAFNDFSKSAGRINEVIE